MGRRRERITLNCQQCGNNFETTKFWLASRKFCSLKCAKAFHFGANHPGWKGPIEKKCKHCGCAFTRQFQSDRRVYCSHQCSAKGRSTRRDGKSIGSRHVGREGYIYIKVAEGVWVEEHRLVATKKIGRALVKGEVVHHRNGERIDNRPENLEVMSVSEHKKKHYEAERIGFEFLAYEPDVSMMGC